MRVIQKYRIPSKSEKGKYHIVQSFDDGLMVCDCIPFQMGRKCRHIKIAERYLNKVKLKAELSQN